MKTLHVFCKSDPSGNWKLSGKPSGGGADDRIDSSAVRSRDVSEEELLQFGDVHGLLDGRVPTADLKEAALQRGPAGHHGEEDSHLVVPESQTTP